MTTRFPETTPWKPPVRKGIRIPSWQTLRALGNSPAVKASAIFPVVGFWILFNEQAQNLLNLGSLDSPPVADWFDLVWSKKTFFLYYGLMLLGIGAFIYQRRCPPEIKKHMDWQSYFVNEGQALQGKLGAMGALLGLGQANYGPHQILELNYLYETLTLPASRLLVTFFLGAGLTILAVPSALSIWKITAIVLR